MNITKTDTSNQAIGILGLFYQNYQLLSTLFITLGTAYLIYLKKWWLILYSAMTLTIIMLLCTFSGMPVWLTGEIQYLERFILLGHVFVSVLIAFGITLVLQILSRPKVFIPAYNHYYYLINITFYIYKL